MAKSHTQRHAENAVIFIDKHMKTQMDMPRHTQSHTDLETMKDIELNQGRDLSRLHSCIRSPQNTARYVNKHLSNNK